jgi:predicted acylesterase/phospholipase RssA
MRCEKQQQYTTNIANVSVQVFVPGAMNFDVFDRINESSRLEPRVQRFLSTGVLMDIAKLRVCLRANIGDLTFAEAFALSGRTFTISVPDVRTCCCVDLSGVPQVIATDSAEPPRVLNHITAPDVLMWSAALASCNTNYAFKIANNLTRTAGALPYVFESVQLMAKRGGVIVP